jgi:hypothetical protein
MAFRVWKDILRTGRVFAQGRFHTFTDADVQEGLHGGKKLISDGYQIPIYWEHQNGGPYKLSEADKAKGTIGRIVDYRVVGGVLEALHEFDNEEDVQKLKSVKYVSPEIDYGWSNGVDDRSGKATITHVAVTPRPVQTNQQPFQLSNGRKYPVIRLSESDYKQGETMEEWFKKALEALAKHGINLPEDTTPENAWERITLICDALAAKGDDTIKPDENKPESGAKPEETKQSQPIAMSLQKQLDRATNLARKDLCKRIEALNKSGRITPQIGEKLTKAVTTVQLSFGDDGELNSNNVLTQIEAYEALPEGSLFKPSGRVALSKGKPELEDDADSPEKTDEIMKQWDATK